MSVINVTSNLHSRVTYQDMSSWCIKYKFCINCKSNSSSVAWDFWSCVSRYEAPKSSICFVIWFCPILLWTIIIKCFHNKTYNYESWICWYATNITLSKQWLNNIILISKCYSYLVELKMWWNDGSPWITHLPPLQTAHTHTSF